MADAIGILGGTFDPIHYGHLRSALEVMESLALAKIHFVANAVPPHRPQPQATCQQRLLMLQLALKNHPQMIADDREIQRQGQSYTIDSLLSFRKQYPGSPLYLLVGIDAFLHIQTWHRWQELLSLSHIVVMQRPGETAAMSAALTAWYSQFLAKENDDQLLAGKIWPIAVTQLAISASDIRSRLARGLNPQFLLADVLIDLIKQLQLYQAN